MNTNKHEKYKEPKGGVKMKPVVEMERQEEGKGESECA